MSFGENLDDLVETSTNGLHAKHESWERVRLGDVATLTNGYPFKSTAFNSAEGTPIVRIRDVMPGKTATYYSGPISDPRMTFIDDGQIAIGMDGDFNSRIWKGGRVLLNQRVCTVQCDEQFYSQAFLAFALPGYLKLINDHTSSITVKHLSSKTVQDIPLPLPPLPEQQRIVEKIETLFAELDKGEEALRAVQKLLARYRQSVLKAAVTGTLTADWRAANPPTETEQELLTRILKERREKWQGRGRYSEPIEPDIDALPELPQGWVWASLDQLAGHLTSGSRDWKQYYGRGSGTFIMAQNVRPMRFDLSQRFSVDPPPGSPDAARSQVALDDLLITIVGANTGDVCRFPLDIDEHYVCQSVALIRLVETELSGFVEFFLSAKGAGRDQLEKHIYGAGRPHLSFEQLRSIAVPLPPAGERAELMRLANEALANVARVEELCKSEVKRSAALRQSILKDAFSGKLVPQDPSDEPAAKLLGRIRADASAPAAGKRRKAAA